MTTTAGIITSNREITREMCLSYARLRDRRPLSRRGLAPRLRQSLDFFRRAPGIPACGVDVPPPEEGPRPQAGQEVEHIDGPAIRLRLRFYVLHCNRSYLCANRDHTSSPQIRVIAPDPVFPHRRENVKRHTIFQGLDAMRQMRRNNQ